MASKPILTEEQINGIVQGMSDGAKSFVKKLAADESFRDKFATAKSAEEMVKLSKNVGIVISMEELKNIMQGASKLLIATGNELADEALEKVSGGSDDDVQWAAVATAA